ncbi:MAG: Asp-tRNA(Asn)/Glu-tRNA(Gln) amidotransferase GatCAB subunit B [Acidobacteria bacterium]|nr:MAG: Asp-tRNA(Asn)/Glu-tRNA(Gln) amidotransferase GatCAB subunit B [Acidobacteriota bacterium]
MEFEPVIGLEVHAQLLTQSKIFCGCTTRFGNPPNTNTCPVCLGMPGVLPVLNRKAVEYAIKVGLAVGCEIRGRSLFARKNYFYPDLPKGYQISMYDQPLCVGGGITIETRKDRKRIGLTRIHLEEDAGKLIHQEGADDRTLVDLNRAGVPLIEIVSEPDIASPSEAHTYLTMLRSILLYLGVCDGNMEEGSLRCDANVSVRPAGEKQFGTKVELKNLNSFRFIQKALEYEINRQAEVLQGGGKVVQESRLYDPDSDTTDLMRGKEEAHDYRYFPEPDLLPLIVDQKWIEEIRAGLPELPLERRDRLVAQYGIPAYDADVLTTTRELADYYEAAAKASGNPKGASNWVMGEVLRKLKEEKAEITACPVSPDRLAGLMGLIEAGTISGSLAKEVFEEMWATRHAAPDIVKARGLTQISDEPELLAIIDQVMAANPGPLAQYRAGKSATLGFFMGQVMKATQGKGNPTVIQKLLGEKLKGS